MMADGVGNEALTYADPRHDAGMRSPCFPHVMASYIYRKHDNSINIETNDNIKIFNSIKSLCKDSSKQKLILISLPSNVVDKCIDELMLYLNKNDIIADLGNSFFLDTRKRFLKVQKKKINFLGIGVSGGPNGAKEGPSIMAGGSKKAWEKI